jgi:hypothetical protein
MKRFHKLTLDLLIVSTQATPFEAIHDWAPGIKEPETYIDYRLADEKVWTDLCAKGELPRGCSYSWLLEKTRA